MRALLGLFLLFAACVPEGEYEQRQKSEDGEFDVACLEKLSLLYPGKEIKRGDWARRYDWRQRLYMVDGRIFRCKQTGRWDPSAVLVVPVTWGDKK